QRGGSDIGGLAAASAGREPGDSPAESAGIGEGDEDGELVRLAHHDEAWDVLVGEPEKGAGRALISGGEGVPGETSGEESEAGAAARRLAQRADEPGGGDERDRREHGGPAGEEIFRLDRSRAEEAVEPGDVHGQPDPRIGPGAVRSELAENASR